MVFFGTRETEGEKESVCMRVSERELHLLTNCLHFNNHLAYYV
jgi:hypothetical protein